ncbi:Ferroporti-1 [Lasiosphaeria miniovina]|uniref:Solute carrier family 40 member n=1 Tax=Lasiosphaeria miniovina TaxID=1954250 RepID=A0AA40AWC8_9PEZI|nr:Ferroporti-1 [Lasiosphaeria miniovina]KAK0723121.1 Ferroporti-1 [Lasiosphaeria miniovina]
MTSDTSEESPLLSSSSNSQQQHVEADAAAIRHGLLWRLYASHFLSTWNMRSYEFTVILLFAQAYPNTLLPTSVRGVLTNGAALLLSPSIGRCVDRNAARFRTMRLTIVVQRAAIVAGCALWAAVFLSSGAWSSPLSTGKDVLVAALVGLGMVERVCAVANNLVMERDWVPTMASAVSGGGGGGGGSSGNPPPLHTLNATMRRIDLVSKILAPVFVSAIAIGAGTDKGALYLAGVTAAMNLGTVGVELVTARGAWDRCVALRQAREAKVALVPGEGGDGDARELLLTLGASEDSALAADDGRGVRRQASSASGSGTRLGRGSSIGSLRLYFSSDVLHKKLNIFPPTASLSAALQSFSVLSLSGPMTTYLLTRAYSLSVITSARTAISAVEIGSTVVFPAAASLLARHHNRRHRWSDPMAVLGLAGVTLQLALLVPCFAALALMPSPSSPSTSASSANDQDNNSPAPSLTVAFFVCLGLSRLGHWTHNLAVQQIAQTRVDAAHRVEFSGVEMAFVSAAEIGRWASTAVWGRPEQFTGVAAGGLASVAVVWALFAAWVVGVVARKRGGIKITPMYCET